MRKIAFVILLLASLARADSFTILGTGTLLGFNLPPGTTSLSFTDSPSELDFFLDSIVSPVSDTFCPTCIFLSGFIPNASISSDAAGDVLLSGMFSGLAAPILLGGDPAQAVNGNLSFIFFGTTIGSRVDWTISASTLAEPSPTPEPGTWMLLATGLFGIAWKFKARSSG